MTSDVAVPMGGALKALSGDLSPTERQKLSTYLAEKVADERFTVEVPRWITELPWAGGDAEVTERIAANVLTAADPDAESAGGGTEASKNLLAKRLTVWDLRVANGDKEGGIGAFLILDVTLDGDDVHRVVTTGAAQAMARLARAWADDDLPCTGSFSAVPGTGAKGSPVITFLVEKAF